MIVNIKNHLCQRFQGKAKPSFQHCKREALTYYTISTATADEGLLHLPFTYASTL